MKYLLVIGCFMLSASKVLGQQEVLLNIPANGKTWTEFIPRGYDTITIAKGDLNKDKQEDIVLVLRSNLETNLEQSADPDSLPARILLVLLKDSIGYRVAAKSSSAILCTGCGGMMGDPFSGVTIEKGIVNVYHYGGSAWRWSYTHKFRYQESDMYLIGQTSLSYWNVENCEKLNEFAGTELMDINFVTGDYEEKKVSQEGCKLLLHKKGKKPKMALKKLNEFTIDN